MSWDLVMWKGAPMEDPPEVWERLAEEQEPRFLRPLAVDEMRRAFEEEYGANLHVEASAGSMSIRGRGWEGSLSDGDKYLYLMCSCGLASDDDWLTQLVRAGLRAGCFVFDPQSGCWWEPPEPGWDPADYDPLNAIQGSDTDA